MDCYMVFYQYTDDEGPHFASLSMTEYADARDLMAELSYHKLASRIQLYKWDPEHNYWIFLLEED